MELVNHTPVPAKMALGAMDAARAGILVAKATFRFDGALETQDPVGLFGADEVTDLGLLPADLVPRRGRAFEVIVLGAAYAAGGQPTRQQLVAVRVGSVERRLAVIGHRTRCESVPAAFERMPLTWDRAYGGTADVYLDPDAVLAVEHPLNKHGRGFDPEPMARGLAAELGTAPGYPVVRDPGLMPNLEDPQALLGLAAADPDPVCWATVPTDIGLNVARAQRQMAASGEVDGDLDRLLCRAHPDWVIPAPDPGAAIELAGLTPGGSERLRFPSLQVNADYCIGARRGTRALVPQMLVLLPEQRRLYVVYRTLFTLDPKPGEERSFRLRLQESAA